MTLKRDMMALYTSMIWAMNERDKWMCSESAVVVRTCRYLFSIQDLCERIVHCVSNSTPN